MGQQPRGDQPRFDRENGFRERRRQVHIWLSELEYASLRTEAHGVGISLSALIRSLINVHLAPSSAERRSVQPHHTRLHRESAADRKV
jgi:hypothetical protein